MTSLRILILFQGSYTSMKLILAPHQRKKSSGNVVKQRGKLRCFRNNSKTFMVQFLHEIVHTWFTHANSMRLLRMRFCCKITEMISLNKRVTPGFCLLTALANKNQITIHFDISFSSCHQPITVFQGCRSQDPLLFVFTWEMRYGMFL